MELTWEWLKGWLRGLLAAFVVLVVLKAVGLL